MPRTEVAGRVSNDIMPPSARNVKVESKKNIMSLNPIHYTENVIGGFLKYQRTAYVLADEHLDAQMRRLLSLEETRRSPLLQGRNESPRCISGTISSNPRDSRWFDAVRCVIQWMW